jgi:hypothetical protein
MIIHVLQVQSKSLITTSGPEMGKLTYKCLVSYEINSYSSGMLGFLRLLLGFQFQGSTVDTVTLSRGGWTIVKDMTKMSIASCTKNFLAGHENN